MISDRVEFLGFDPERVANLVELGSAEPSSSWPAAVAGPPGLVVVRDGPTVLKALHTRAGRLEPAEIDLGLGAEALAAAHRTRWAAVIEASAMEAASESAAARLRPGADLVDLGLELARAFRRERRAGRLEIWPCLLDELPIPERRDLERAFDLVLPPRSTALLYVFDGPVLHAEGIVGRGERDIEVLAGHDALGAGPPPRGFRDEHRRILEAVERRFWPPSVALFVTLETARAAVRGQLEPGDLARLGAQRDFIVDPLPAWLAAPLGLVAVRGAVEAGRKAGEALARRIDPGGIGGKLASRFGGAIASRLGRSAVVDRVQQTVGAVGGHVELAGQLGFDPFALVARLMELCRPADPGGDERP